MTPYNALAQTSYNVILSAIRTTSLTADAMLSLSHKQWKYIIIFWFLSNQQIFRDTPV